MKEEDWWAFIDMWISCIFAPYNPLSLPQRGFRPKLNPEIEGTGDSTQRIIFRSFFETPTCVSFTPRGAPSCLRTFSWSDESRENAHHLTPNKQTKISSARLDAVWHKYVKKQKFDCRRNLPWCKRNSSCRKKNSSKIPSAQRRFSSGRKRKLFLPWEEFFLLEENALLRQIFYFFNVENHLPRYFLRGIMFKIFLTFAILSILPISSEVLI